MRMRVFLCILIGWWGMMIHAQLLPPIYNYTPSEYKGESQNWKICQADNKKIYFANNIGLLEFNGVVWQRYPLPNGAIARAVSAKGNTLYTGGFAEFGYWQPNKFNELQYTSLSSQLNPADIEDEEIWKIIFSDRWVLFQSLHKIFIYDTQQQRFKIISATHHLPKIFKIGEHIYFQKMKEGLFKLVNGEEVLVTDHPLFREHILINLLPQKEHFLFVTQDKGIYEGTPTQIEAWKVSASQLINTLNI